MRFGGPDGVLNYSGQLWHHPTPEGIKWGMVCQRLFLSFLPRALYKLHDTLGLAQTSLRQSGFGVLAGPEVPSWAFNTLCEPSGLPWECLVTSDSRTPFFFAGAVKFPSMSMAAMLTAHRASNTWSELALQGLFLVLSPVPWYHMHGNTLSWWLAWQHTCPWPELRGLIPIWCQEGKLKPHPQDVQSLFLLLACVSLQSEAQHQRNADAPMAR